jgi:hypothetical protein
MPYRKESLTMPNEKLNQETDKNPDTKMEDDTAHEPTGLIQDIPQTNSIEDGRIADEMNIYD